MTAPFHLTDEQHAALYEMRPADRDLMLEKLAQSHHYRTFNVVGKWRSLDGIPQMRAWERGRDALISAAHAEYARVRGERRAA